MTNTKKLQGLLVAALERLKEREGKSFDELELDFDNAIFIFSIVDSNDESDSAYTLLSSRASSDHFEGLIKHLYDTYLQNYCEVVPMSVPKGSLN